MSEQNKKVLIITYYWPPSGGAGVQRWLKFVKYLPEYGWEPIVLTVDTEYASYTQWDKSLEKDVNNNIQVIRTRSFEILEFYKKISPQKELPYGGFANESKPGLFQKVMRFIRGNFFLPDPRKGWNKYAYKEAFKIINNNDIANIITTGPPHSTHFIGKKLKENTGVKWIADFRDPWTDIYYYKDLYHTFLAKRRDLCLERSILETSDNVLVVSKGMADLYCEKYPELSNKIEILTNGFDPQDFPSDRPEVYHDKLTLSYTGTLSNLYEINGLVQSVSKLDKTLQKQLRLNFVGKVASDMKDKLMLLEDLVEINYIDYVPHSESINYLLKSHALLLLIPNIAGNKGILTGKFFEYYAAGKPIIMIGDLDSDLAHIIKNEQSGSVHDYHDVEKLLVSLNELFQQFSEGKLQNQKELPEKFCRKSITKQLSEII